MNYENVRYKVTNTSVEVTAEERIIAKFTDTHWIISNEYKDLVKVTKPTTYVDYLYFYGMLHDVHNIHIPSYYKPYLFNEAIGLICKVNLYDLEIRKRKDGIRIYQHRWDELIAMYEPSSHNFEIFEYMDQEHLSYVTHVNKLVASPGLFKYLLKQYYDINFNELELIDAAFT